MMDTGKRKFTMLAATGLAALSLGGTLLVADAIQPPATTYAATSSKQALANLLAKGKIILANKTLTDENKELVKGYQDIGQEAYDSGNEEAYKDASKSLGGFYSSYDNKGNFNGYSVGSSNNSDDLDNMGDNTATAEEPGEKDPHPGSTSTSSDPIADTQDAHEYEESTAQADNNQGSSDSNSDSDATNDVSSHGSSNSTNAASSSTKPNSHSSSAFSEESVDAPGNAGRHVSSSSASSTTPAKANTAKKGNLPGTGEDSRNVVLISVIGILGILGLGGTALALWLRQRKHVNNE